MNIRTERPSDTKAIFSLTKDAFAPQPFASGTEQFIVDALRAAGALTLSLVAEEEDGGIVGHVAFSPVTISDGSVGWYGLGPVSVARPVQKRGIGSALIRDGLTRLKSLGAAGCVLLGDPGYYGRFGFAATPRLMLAGVPPDHFLMLAFGDNDAHGAVSFHPAFDATQ